MDGGFELGHGPSRRDRRLPERGEPVPRRCARHDRRRQRPPWGTFLVNISGSFLLGITFALVSEPYALPAELRIPLVVGFIGSYTTFATPLLRSWLMFESGAGLAAAANLVGSVLAGIVAVVAGLLIGRAL